MDINKTDMFEKFFNGFQERFIESFKAAGEEKIYVQLLENHKASKESYRTYFNCAWEFLEKTTIAEQQAKLEELQKQLIDQGQRFNEQAQVVKDLEFKNGELQKRVDAALKLMQKPLIVGEPAKYVCARFKEIEQALKGEGQ